MSDLIAIRPALRLYLAGNKLTVAGHWSNNAPISGTWSLTQ